MPEQKEMCWMRSVKMALDADIIYACGPTPMLRALKDYAAENNIECWISMEERMACGIGACLACVCKSKEKDAHTNVHNKRICKEGPVFLCRGGRTVMNMKVDLCGVTLNNPVMTASGTFGSGAEYAEFVDLNKSGSCCDKRCCKCSVAGKSDTACRRSIRRHVKCSRTSEPGN